MERPEGWGKSGGFCASGLLCAWVLMAASSRIVVAKIVLRALRYLSLTVFSEVSAFVRWRQPDKFDCYLMLRRSGSGAVSQFCLLLAYFCREMLFLCIEGRIGGRL